MKIKILFVLISSMVFLFTSCEDEMDKGTGAGGGGDDAKITKYQESPVTNFENGKSAININFADRMNYKPIEI